MPETLYDTDVFTWSERQADLLRRLARGERVNAEIDWRHVVEEVRDVGRSELRAVQSLLGRGLDHLMKMHGWPVGPVEHWRGEALWFLLDAQRNYVPSMRRSIVLPRIYRQARLHAMAMTIDGQPPRAIPELCPYRLGDLLVGEDTAPDMAALVQALEARDG